MLRTPITCREQRVLKAEPGQHLGGPELLESLEESLRGVNPFRSWRGWEVAAYRDLHPLSKTEGPHQMSGCIIPWL